jgi:exodeoxyribonuclease VIII
LNPKEDTDALRFGRIFHMAVLEPELFRDNVIVMPEFTGMTKDGKVSTRSKAALDKKAEWLSENEGKTIMTMEERDHLLGMLDKLQSMEVIMNIIRTSKPEASFFCTDPVTKLLLKTRPDLTNLEAKILVDFKSTRSAHPDDFLRQIEKERYDIQLMFQKLVVEVVMGIEIKAVALIASEKTNPYSCVVYQLGEPIIKGDNVVNVDTSRDYMELGSSWARHGLNIMKECVVRDFWPGYTNQVVVAKPSNWLVQQPLPLIEFPS